MQSLDFVTKFSPETSQEDLQKDIILQSEKPELDFEDIEVEMNIDEINYEDYINEDYINEGYINEDYVYKDTIVVPAKIDGFKSVFLGENRWYSINISRERFPYLKYIAAYQSSPISAVTHVARIGGVEESPYHSGKKMIIFDGKARRLKRTIPMGKYYSALQGPRYTNHKKLNIARTTDDLFIFDDLLSDD